MLSDGVVGGKRPVKAKLYGGVDFHIHIEHYCDEASDQVNATSLVADLQSAIDDIQSLIVTLSSLSEED